MSHARTASRPHAATVARTVITTLAAGFLSISAVTFGGARPSGTKASDLTLTGTTLGPDGRTPVPRVRITVMPESTVTFTDSDGDFFVAWNGREGWITVIPEEPAYDGTEWCRRVVLRPRPVEAQDPLVDLGVITVVPKAKLHYQQVPALPEGYARPASLRAAGPGPGEPDTCRTQLSFGTDLWGRATRVELSGGDAPPVGLRDAIFAWVRSVPWTVATETSCEFAEPFKTSEWMDYAWGDTAWVRVSAIKNQARPKPPGTVPPVR